MPGRTIDIPGVGQATMYKRRGMRTIRVSVSLSGKVRINMPKWAPYLAAERFALKNRDWIEQQLAKRPQFVVKNGDVIGRGAIVKIQPSLSTRTTSKVSPNSIVIRTNLKPTSQQFQQKVRLACEKALRLQAEAYLPNRTAELAAKHRYKYAQLKVKRLTSRWGSCSHKASLSLSFFLMQLPDQLVDYVILHELTHTEQMTHGPKFWSRLDQSLPGAKKIRKQMANYQPLLSGKGKFDNIDKADLPLR